MYTQVRDIIFEFSLLLSLSLSAATSNPFTQKPPLFSTLLYSLVPIMGIAAIALLSFWMYRHHKLAYPPVLVPTQVRLNAFDENVPLISSSLESKKDWVWVLVKLDSD